MAFVATTTSTAAYYEITGKFWSMIHSGAVARGWLNIGLTVMVLACVIVVVGSAVARWLSPRRSGELPDATRAGDQHLTKTPSRVR
jgi:carbon starvation protein